MGSDTAHVEALISKSEYADAIKLANTVISKEPGNGEALVARSVANLRLGKVQESLEDAEKAVACTNGELRADAQLRRAFALQRLGRDGEAASVLKYAQNRGALNRYNILAHKLKGVTPIDVPEIPVGSKAPVVTEQNAKTPAAADTAPKAAVVDTTNSHSPAPVTPPSVRKDWYQSSTNINLDVYLRGAQDKSPQVDIGEQTVSIKYEDVDFKVKLAHLIDDLKSTYTVSPYKFSFVLAKVEPAQWASLEFSESQTEPLPRKVETASQAHDVKPTTQTKYKAAFEKNWDNIDSDDDDVPGASGDPNEFFSQIYKNADPDTQRAMMKSFVESKGTTLSTNWDEVKQGVVEPQPPKDMKIS